MKNLRFKKFLGRLLLLMLVGGNVSAVFAHGGEDHGEAKPKIETSAQGTVSRVMRLGDLELLLKHPALAPDAATAAKLFITKFENNQGFAEAVPTIEIEAANGSLNAAKIEKTDAAGVFNVALPALPAGTYTVRAKVTHGGETDTATFSNVAIETVSPGAAADGEMSWTRMVLIAFVMLLVLGLFGGLAYFVLKFGSAESFDEKAVSA